MKRHGETITRNLVDGRTFLKFEELARGTGEISAIYIQELELFRIGNRSSENTA